MLLPASVKSKNLSGEIGWRLDELEDKFCDFLRLAQTVGGNLFPESVHFLGGEAVVHGSINNTAGDGVDLDITGSQLLGQCFGEAVHTTLGGGVSHFHGSSHISPDGGNIDNASAVLQQHQRHCQTAGVEAGAQVRIQDMLPFFDTHIREQTNVRDSGVVDQYIQMVQGGKNFFDGSGFRCVRSHGGAGDAIFFF